MSRKSVSLTLQIVIKIVAECWQISAAGLHDLFSLDVVRKRIEEMFERKVCVASRFGFPVRNAEN
tara:strand:- start:1602 stop:1796 length:195 start_codon:yes stop_codon:yes gene_type:complete